MSSEFTKGKWLSNAFGKIFAEIPGKQDQPIANVLYYKTPRGEANARLIAAAPALLEALEKIEAIEKGCKKRGAGYDSQIHDIAKATISEAKK